MSCDFSARKLKLRSESGKRRLESKARLTLECGGLYKEDDGIYMTKTNLKQIVQM